ncbi:MFS transporter, partial [Burkholderia pseudomallei]
MWPELLIKYWVISGIFITYSFATAIVGGTARVFCAFLFVLSHFIGAPASYLFLRGMLGAAAIYKIYTRSKTN